VHEQVPKHHLSFLLQSTQQRSQSQLLGCAPATPLTRMLPRLCLRKGGNKDGKIFTICDVDTTAIFSCGAMKTLLRDIVTGDFDIGFVNRSSAICNRNDILDVWSELR